MMRSSAGARSLTYERIGGRESGQVGNLTDEPSKVWPEPPSRPAHGCMRNRYHDVQVEPHPRRRKQRPREPHRVSAEMDRVELKERSATQKHFLDICRVIGHTTPAELNRLRRAQLDPEGAPEAELKKCNLTNLFNARPTWLQHAHATLDRAVWAVYGWDDPVPADVEEDPILARLQALNLERLSKHNTRC